MRKTFLLLFVLMLFGCNNVNKNTVSTTNNTTLPTFSTNITSTNKLDDYTRRQINIILKSRIPDLVENDLTLLNFIEEYNASVSWSSSNEQVISKIGKVKRSFVEEEVTIKAKVLIGDKGYEVYYNVIVKPYDIAPQKVVTDNINLVNKIDEIDAAISWESSDENVISKSGVISRGFIDREIILTATIKINDELIKIAYNVTVKSYDLTPDSIIYGDLECMKVLEQNKDIINWESSDEKYISKNGIVFRDYDTHEVTLTLTITEKGVTKIEKFVVKVMPKEKEIKKENLIVGYLYGSMNITEKMIGMLDQINYSFAMVENGKIKISEADKIVIKKLVEYKKTNDIKICLAIGGWGADGFSDAVLTSESRTIFVDSIIKAVKELNLSGIDIDWEYPGSSAAGIKSRPADKTNFTLFITELYQKLKAIDENYILSIAVGSTYQNSLETKKLNSVIDFLNIMTYDGTWGVTSHHTSLYPSAFQTLGASSCVDNWHKAGIDLNKIFIGSAFYGRKYSPNTTNSNGMGLIIDSYADNYASYQTIKDVYLKEGSGYIRYFDEIAKAPWLYNGKTFVTYDDPESLKYKCEYVKENVRGLMFWNLAEDPSLELLTTIYENMK